MVDRQKLSSRLSALEGYLAELRGFRRYRRDQFLREPAVHHLAERYLHLACECVLDIAHHVIAASGLALPATYKEAIDALQGNGLIDEELAIRLKDWMGFRNVLVHLYLEIDHARTHRAIEQDLPDLERFAAAMAKLL
jgi:uncharacterized protein YutE (UPF0331/DUF86 family)